MEGTKTFILSADAATADFATVSKSVN